MSEKEVRLLEECELTSALLKSGLHSLRKANLSDKGVYYRAFFELSIAIERMLKIIIILEYRVNHNGDFPDINDKNITGHKLNELWNTAGIIPLTGVSKKILKFLDKFARYTRYYNLDTILEKSSGNTNHISVLGSWESIQNDILKIHGRKEFKNKEKLSEILEENSMILLHGMQGEEITSVRTLLDDAANRDLVQGYSVLYTFKIISILNNKIKDLETQGYYLPVVSEFFVGFNDYFKDSEIRKKRDWLNAY